MSNGLRDERSDGAVEGAGDDVIGGGLIDGMSESISGGDFHPFGNASGSDVESSTEDSGEGEDVVDLIREITATSADDGCAGIFGDVGHDLGFGICHGENYGVFGHGFDVFGIKEVAFTDTNEDIGSFEDFGEASGAVISV